MVLGGLVPVSNFAPVDLDFLWSGEVVSGRVPNLLMKELPSNLLILALAAIPMSVQSQTVVDEDTTISEFQETFEETATLFPIPDYSGDFLNRPAFTGDWGGVRTQLAKSNGLQFVFDATQIYQGVMDGGLDERSDYSGSADYRVRFDSGQSGLWEGGFLDIHGETFWGGGVNLATGAVLPVNTDRALSAPAGNGTYLPQVQFTQFLSEKFAVTLGKLDTTVGDGNSFAHGVGDRGFMNLGFSFNPTVLTTAPYSTLGAGFVYFLAPRSSFTFSAIDTDGRIDESGFDTVFEGNTSYVGELNLGTQFFDKPGHQLFAFSYASGSFNSQNQDPRILFASDAPASTESDSWAFYYNFEQYLISSSSDPEQGFGLFGRIGVADEDTSFINTFYSLGVGGKGFIPGRDLDRFGLGYYYMTLSDKRIGLLTDDDEQGVELFYNMAVTPAFELSLDLQVIDGAVKNTDTAVVGGVRARLVF